MRLCFALLPEFSRSAEIAGHRPFGIGCAPSLCALPQHLSCPETNICLDISHTFGVPHPQDWEEGAFASYEDFEHLLGTEVEADSDYAHYIQSQNYDVDHCTFYAFPSSISIFALILASRLHPQNWPLFAPSNPNSGPSSSAISKLCTSPYCDTSTSAVAVAAGQGESHIEVG